jgi:hypothetical protein
MDAEEQMKLRKKIALLVPAVFMGLGLIFFVPAGTLDYWEAWVYRAVLFVPFLFVFTYLLRKDRNCDTGMLPHTNGVLISGSRDIRKSPVIGFCPAARLLVIIWIIDIPVFSINDDIGIFPRSRFFCYRRNIC